MILFYFGADAPWREAMETSIRRRNMALLSAISKDEDITKVFNVIRCKRSFMFQKLKENEGSDQKISNLYIAPILPERGVLHHITRPINRLLLKAIYPKVLGATRKNKTASWCYWPQGFEDYQYLGLNNDMVFDTDHNIIDDPNLSDDQKQNREKLLVKAGKEAKYILSSSRSMLQWYQHRELENTRLLMNGVFQDRIDLKEAKIKKPSYQVTYCGTLSKWINTEWLFKLADDHPTWSINIIGENYKSTLSEQLKTHQNIVMHGLLEPTDVDTLIKQSDVCFGLYQKKEALDVNSMKLYDYLAQGVSVVVNDYHLNLKEDFQDLLNLASTYEEFVACLKSPKPIDKQNLESFLNAATWTNRVKPVLQNLKNS